MNTSVTLGERLKEAREMEGWSLEAVSQRIHIAVKYLAALEESAYDRLPGRVYAEGFLKRYAQFLHLSQARALSMFRAESKITLSRAASVWGKTPRSSSSSRATRVWLTPGILRVIGAGMVVAVLLGYLGIQIRDVVSPPDLLVTKPHDNVVTQELSVMIAGQSEPETVVTINGQSVAITREGSFEERVDLKDGLNVVKIAATKKHSKENVIYKQILVEKGNKVTRHE